MRLTATLAEQLPAEPPPGPELTGLPEELRAALEPLARGLAGSALGPRAQAAALERFFHEQFAYSLETDLRGKGHPLVVLVRERRATYCVYFASAMAALLRSLGTPARLVGGFVPGDQDPLGGRALVRERDAHAWVEVWSAGDGRWLAFDPTPVGAGRAPGDSGAAHQRIGQRAARCHRRDGLDAGQGVWGRA